MSAFILFIVFYDMSIFVLTKPSLTYTLRHLISPFTPPATTPTLHRSLLHRPSRTILIYCSLSITQNSFLHDPRTLQTARSDRWWNFPTSVRGILNALGIGLLLGGFLALFMGWPIHTCKLFFLSCMSALDESVLVRTDV